MPPRKKKLTSNRAISPERNEDKTAVSNKRPRTKKDYKESEDEDDEHSPTTKTLSDSSDDNEPKPKRRSKKTQPSKSSSKKEKPEREAVEDNDSVTVDYDKKGSMKIVSWNINGIRAWLPKGGLDYLKKESPDVLCVQETKCSDDKLPKDLESIKGYKSYFLSGDKEGYSGVGILSKIEPLKVTYGIGMKEHDAEGRVITMEFDDFFLVNAYVPNAGRGLVRLDYRMQWDKDFRKYLKKLKEKKDVILTGDLNVAHQEIDLANPKSNKRNAGFTQEERDGLTALLDEGFVDTFRKLYPDRAKAYTFWTYMMNARAKNVGWRLDYFIVSQPFMDRIVDNEIRDKVMGSDHCPIVLHIK